MPTALRHPPFGGHVPTPLEGLDPEPTLRPFTACSAAST
jgi:hypothetical protein